MNIASIQNLTGEYYVWEELASQKTIKGMRKICVPPVVRGTSPFWTNSEEIAKAISETEGNVNENIARATER